MREGGEVFELPTNPLQRRYEAMRAYLYDGKSAKEVACCFGYKPESVGVLAARFRQEGVDSYFREMRSGRKYRPVAEPLCESILALRRENLSITEIAERLRESGRSVGHQTVWLVLRDSGIERLPRRTAAERSPPPRKISLPAANVKMLELTTGRAIQCRAPLLLLFAPHIAAMKFDALVEKSGYPGTSHVPASAYLRSFLALKLMFRPRKSNVMSIADDEGFGLFAGLNALPKTTALHDYSYRMGPGPHRKLLHGIIKARYGMGIYTTSSFNLDFHTICHYGDTDNSCLENDYVPRRSQSVPGIITAFAQEYESREMIYAHANLLKREKSEEALSFVRYWKKVTGKLPKELVLDARVTTHEGLAELNRIGIIFITLRERRENEIARVLALPADKWKRVELDVEDRKWRTPRVLDERIKISKYPGTVRQIAALDLGREQPTFLLTNDKKRGPATLLTRYARRTLIENSLNEQVHFFHVDALSSCVRIKVDLDVVLSVAASGCYRWLARHLRGFESATARKLWETFLDRPGTIRLTDKKVVLSIRRFSRAPVLLEAAKAWEAEPVPWLGDRSIRLKVL